MNKNNLSAADVGTDQIASAYDERSMSEASDVRFVAAVGDVVQQSRSGAFDSFVLHAPLELAARAALLAYVSPSHRRRSRLRILAIAAVYEAFGPGAAVSVDQEAGSPSITGFIDAVEAGDPDAAEEAALRLAVLDPGDLVRLLADFVVPLTSAAAHAPIFLHLLQRSDPRGSISARLLAPLARELARDNGKAIRWVERFTAQRPTDAGKLERQLRTVPSIDVESTFIHPIMEAVDGSGVARTVLGETLGRFDRSSASSVLRVAAASMIHDDPASAPYGWTHCLTIPQAMIEIAPSCHHPDIALAVAATHVVGFRAALGNAQLPDRPHDSYSAVDIDAVIDAASTHRDAHVVKYALACLDAAAYDPQARNLYHSAAAHLLDVWESLPATDDPLAGPGSVG